MGTGLGKDVVGTGVGILVGVYVVGAGDGTGDGAGLGTAVVGAGVGTSDGAGLGAEVVGGDVSQYFRYTS